MPVKGYVFLALLVLWSLGLLFVVPAAVAKGLGLAFLGIGVFVSLLHRLFGWLMFKISRALHIDYQSYEGLGQQGAQAWYLDLGLIMIGIGCIYLTRSII